MREMSFAMLPGIGPAFERRIWGAGVRSWDSFLETRKITGISGERKQHLDTRIREGKRGGTDPAFLAGFFPRHLHWRCWEDLMAGAAFLDIETDGLSRFSSVTVIGIHRKGDSRMISLVRGRGLNPCSLREALDGVSMLVTYNGASFDLPFINQRFPGCLPQVPHFDLRIAARHLGYRGGLKSLERELGIARDFEVATLAGEDALLYWKMWHIDRNRGALRLLLKYNREDVENLIPLSDILYGNMVQRTLGVLPMDEGTGELE